MKNVSEDVRKVYFMISDMKRSMQICEYGLETAGNVEALSLIGIYTELLDGVESKLKDILELLDNGNLDNAKRI